MLGRISRRQLVYWMAFLEREPLAADRDDIRAAVHFTMLANRFTHLEPVDGRDMVIDWQAAAASVTPQSPEEKAEADIAAILARFG